MTIAKSDEYTKANALAAVLEYIEENKVTYYHHLMRWAKALGDYDVFCCVTGRCSMFLGLFRSMREEKAEEKANEEKERKDNEKAIA